MGKDKSGKFHPQKGRPSASLKAEQTGLKSIGATAIGENQELVDKYTVGDEPASNLHIRHRNRNPDKKEEKQKERKLTLNKKTKRLTAKKDSAGPVPQLMLPVLTKELFAELANFQSPCCISFYIPTHSEAGAQANERMDITLFKKMLQQTESLLKQKNIQEDEIEKMLKPGYGLLKNDDVWTPSSSGLAVFISEGLFKYMKMNIAPKEEILINTSFYVTPLIPLLTNSDYFYLLVLSKKQARLYRADAFGMNYIKIDALPRGVDDVVHFEEKDDQKLFRTDTAGAGQGANFHGIGAGKPDDKANIAMYFDEVDETLWKEILHRENVPLLLAGVEYLIPIYKSVAKYKPICDDSITGNHEHEDHNSLYQLARKKMESYFDERHAKALEAYANQSATQLTSSVAADVIPAAHYKRVWHLFVQKDEHIWGKFDERNNKLTIHDTQQDGDECLIDKAVIKTILNAGEVHVLPKDRMPGGSQIAALMRYPI